MPALVLGLEDHSTVRAHEVKDMAILLHDGLCWTYRTSICRVLLQGTTGRLGLGAYLELFLNFRRFPFSSLVLPSRTPKGYNASRWVAELQNAVVCLRNKSSSSGKSKVF